MLTAYFIVLLWVLTDFISWGAIQPSETMWDSLGNEKAYK